MTQKKQVKSGLDTIDDINRNILTLMQMVEVLDSNIKLANNKISKLNKAINILSVDYANPSASNSGIKSAATTPSEQIVSTGNSAGFVIGKIKLFGASINADKSPISNVQVNVINSNGDTVKSRTTDSAGKWDVRLPPGQYQIEYLRAGFRPARIKITLADDIESFEVK